MNNQPIQPNSINWADLYFTADCDQETFTDMVIVTAKSEFVAVAKQLVLQHTTEISDQMINDLAKQYIEAGKVSISEFAEVKDDNVFVCINAELDDENTNFKALDIAYAAIENGGFWKSPISLSWDVSELSEFFTDEITPVSSTGAN
jgi:hypothetical protein